MRLFLLALMLGIPVSALADGFCDVTDVSEVHSRIAGKWHREGSMSFVNATTDMERPSDPYITEFFETGLVANKFYDDLTGAMQLADLVDTLYDVDKVDDMLDTTGRSDFADVLSDTLCGPDQLPQLVVKIELPVGNRSQLAGAPDIGVFGTVTYVAYFDDRLLEISELTVKTDETVAFLTETALLTPYSE